MGTPIAYIAETDADLEAAKAKAAGGGAAAAPAPGRVFLGVFFSSLPLFWWVGGCVYVFFGVCFSVPLTTS